jgi:TolA-binding protein
MADAYIKKGDIQSAIDEYKALIAKYPRMTYLQDDLARAEALLEGQG